MTEIRCQHCGKVLKLSEPVVRTVDNLIICSDCARHYYNFCVECDLFYPKAEKYCRKCQDRIYDNIINSYSTKPIPIFFGDTYNVNFTNRYFGLEWEISNVSPLLAYMLLKKSYTEKKCFSKKDGSIENGVEIVTNPMTKDYLFKFLDSCREFASCLKSTERPTYNAGIHIHVNRASISSHTITKLNYLLNSSCTPYEAKILYYISGRNRTTNCDTTFHRYTEIGHGISHSTTNKYIALNLLHNDTLEFRLFKSTINIDTIKMYINFVSDMIRYAETNNLCNMTISKFIDWEYENYSDVKIKKKIDNYFNKNNISCTDKKKITFDWNTLRDFDIDSLISKCEKAYRCKNIVEINKLFNGYPNTRSNTPLNIYTKEINCLRRIENTIRKVLIHKIIKWSEENVHSDNET